MLMYLSIFISLRGGGAGLSSENDSGADDDDDDDMREPVNTEHDEHEGGEDVSSSSDHHQNLASHVPSMPLKHSTLSSPFYKCTYNIIITITSMMILQLVSMGMVMKEMTVSAMVRWNTR